MQNLLIAIIVLIALAALKAFLSSPERIGRRGEARVSRLINTLPAGEYSSFNDLILPTPDGLTQIDHLIVSIYGVFVIETKNYDGWIFGSAEQKQWTQTIYGKKSRFQNPQRQNFKHTQAVERLLDLSRYQVHSVIVFARDRCEFKTNMPPNVIKRRQLINYVRSFNLQVIDTTKLEGIQKSLLELSEASTREARDRHLRQLQARSDASANRLCPKCGSALVLRAAKSGRNAGHQFWGCSKFPACRFTQKL